MSRYSRSSVSSIGFPPWTRAVKTLVIICAAVFVLQVLERFAGGDLLKSAFGLTPSLVTHDFFLWQLVTYIFLHDPWSLTHILFNMLGLWMFGSDLERHWGTPRFVKYFFICGIGGGVLLVLLSWNSPIPTIGASGAVYGILLAFGMLFPNRIIYFIIFPIPAKWFVVMMGALTFWSSLSSSSSNVAHFAHLGGMLFGFLYLKGGRMMPGMKWQFDKWKRDRLRRKFEVYYNDRHRDDDQKPRWKN